MLFSSLGFFEVFFLSMIVGSGVIAVTTLGMKFIKDTSNNPPHRQTVLTDFNRNQLKGKMASRNR